jgi:hypothetical protein
MLFPTYTRKFGAVEKLVMGARYQPVIYGTKEEHYG